MITEKMRSVIWNYLMIGAGLAVFLANLSRREAMIGISFAIEWVLIGLLLLPGPFIRCSIFCGVGLRGKGGIRCPVH